jgi:hypothetical protein
VKIYFLPLIIFVASCATTLSTTGEPGISMGDSYEEVLEKLKPSHTIVRVIEGRAIRAEGYSSLTKDCRTKYFIFPNQGKDGLQAVKTEPAPHLSVEHRCK